MSEESPVDAPEEVDTPVPAITARAITMSGPWGPVYGPIDLDIEAGGVSVLICPPGTARSALLLTIAGRMSPASGTLEVFGRRRAKDIFKLSGIAAVEDLDAVSESVTVRDLVTEQIRWDAPWYQFIGRADQAALQRLCGPVFGDLPLPVLDSYVNELTELDHVLLRIALANTAQPAVLVVAGLDQVASDRHRDELIDRLVDLGTNQTIVTASANPIVGHGIKALVPVSEDLDEESR